MGIAVRYLGGVVNYFCNANLTGFNLVVSVTSVVELKVVHWFQKETYFYRSGVNQRMEQKEELSNKFKNYHSLRSFGRANARPF